MKGKFIDKAFICQTNIRDDINTNKIMSINSFEKIKDIRKKLKKIQDDTSSEIVKLEYIYNITKSNDYLKKLTRTRNFFKYISIAWMQIDRRARQITSIVDEDYYNWTGLSIGISIYNKRCKDKDVKKEKLFKKQLKYYGQLLKSHNTFYNIETRYKRFSIASKDRVLIKIIRSKIDNEIFKECLEEMKEEFKTIKYE